MKNIEANKVAARALLEVAFDSAKSVDEKRALLPRYLNEQKYIQHCPSMGDGFEGLMALLTNLANDFDGYSIDVKRLVAEGDYVVAHCLYRFGRMNPKEKVIFELFRVEDGKMVEHWDAIQDVPAEPLNSNGMI